MMRLAQRNRQLLTSAVLILVLLLALGLRLYRIESQSLWNDEGTSVALAARDLVTITRSAANDIHPPLYYYVLHFWMAICGDSELAVRSLSALLGTLLVLLIFALGRSMADGAVGLVASFLAALSPFQIYYSQETRMYALAAFLGAVSMYAFTYLLSVWRRTIHTTDAPVSGFRRCLPCAAYATATILLLYTHYFAATVVVAQNLAFLWWLAVVWRQAETRRSCCARSLLHWCLLQVAVAVAYSPWLLLTARQLGGWPAISESLSFTGLLLDLLRVFSLGLSSDARSDLVLVGFAALLLLAMVVAVRRQEQDATRDAESWVAYLLYLFVPIGMMYALSLRRPMYDPKFLLLSTPPFYLFLAEGTLFLSRRSGRIRRGSDSKDSVLRWWPWVRVGFPVVAVAFLAGSSVCSLQAYYSDPRYARDDYRGIAQYIEAIQQGNDVVLINAPGQIETFTYYYEGGLPLYPLPRQRPLDKAKTEAELREMIQGRGRVFAVLWATDESDPERFLEGWLDQHAYKATDSWYGNVRLVIYAVPAQSPEGGIEHPLDVTLGDQVRLLGYSLLTPEVMPGGILQLTLFWQAAAPVYERYKVFAHVIDAHGHLVGQRDAEPGGGAKITTSWEEDEQIIDNYGLPILPATPPGDYLIKVGMYGLEDGVRLPVSEAGVVVDDHIVLQPVRVLPAAAPPPLSVLGMNEQLNVRFGDVSLLGYDLTKLGHEHQPDAPIHPGDIVHLTLFWQANRVPDAAIELLVQLQDQEGTVRAERRSQPSEGQYPSHDWRAHEIVRDQHNLHLPPDLPAGRYRMYLSVHRLSDHRAVGSQLALTSVMIQ